MTSTPVGMRCPECARHRTRVKTMRSVEEPTATYALIGVNVLVGAGLILGGAGGGNFGNNQLYDLGALSRGTVADGEWWRLVTSGFIHGAGYPSSVFLHLLFNMFALWVLGGMLEPAVGRLRFLLIYFTTGIFASAASYAFGTPGAVGAGASGAIFGLFGAFFAYNYRRRSSALAAARLQQMVRLIVLNAILALSLHFIDWRAHLGGLVAGVAAGYVAEGWGNLSKRRVILVVGFSAILLGAVSLVAWRTAELTRDPAIGPFLTGLAQVGSGAAR
jgi:membrane associated rhomboid family serine protease